MARKFSELRDKMSAAARADSEREFRRIFEEQIKRPVYAACPARRRERRSGRWCR